MQASESKSAGNLEQARRYSCMSLLCNIGSFAYYAAAVVGIVIAVAVTATADSNNYDYNYDY